MLNHKMLLDKGFIPTWYTDSYFKDEGRNRLFYEIKNVSKELFTSIMSGLELWNEYFWILDNDEVMIEIGITENLDEVYIYFYNADCDNLILTDEQVNLLFKILPNRYVFGYEY